MLGDTSRSRGNVVKKNNAEKEASSGDSEELMEESLEMALVDVPEQVCSPGIFDTRAYKVYRNGQSCHHNLFGILWGPSTGKTLATRHRAGARLLA